MSRYDLAGKTVLITGGARGIGFETARIAYRRGASVSVIDVDGAAAEAAAERIGDRAIGIGADVTDAEQIETAVAWTAERLGRVDVVVANAGITPPKTTTRAISTEDWERILDVNLMGVWRTVRAGLPEVVANRGQLVLISSSYAHVNGTLNSSYAVSKASVEALGRALRVELAAHGASATVAYFGYVKTDLNSKVFDNELAERFREEIAPSFLTRQMSVEDAAEALVRGIEHRSPRVIEPRIWRPVFYLRGLLGPLSDKQLEDNPKVADFIHQFEERDMKPGSG
ncbi:MAG TPA: SDR family NAD(P)-dependent oxidoreductase [Solirubrobacterales bacterium]|nr:SDR family NAD(P)-dependent oxidoreductase [Solirubrobacterales bacterium]